jgi:hypothetical protein
MALLGCTPSLVLKFNNTQLLEAIWPQASLDVGCDQLAVKDKYTGYAASTQATKEEALSVS